MYDKNFTMHEGTNSKTNLSLSFRLNRLNANKVFSSKNESLAEFCTDKSVFTRTLTLRLLSCGHLHKSMKAYGLLAN